MKRVIPILALLLLAVLLCGCDGTDPSVKVENTVPSFDKTEEVAVGEYTFSVRSKKYTYEGTDLVILNVTNQSGKTLAVNINAQYIDDEGDSVGSDSKVFETFPNGFETNFIFWPNYRFDAFAYQIECEETDKECLVNGYSAEISKLLAGSVIDYGKFHKDETRQGVYISVKESNTCAEPLDVGERYMIIFGENDTVLSIGCLSAMGYFMPSTAANAEWKYVVCRATGNGLDALQGDVKGLIIPAHVKEIPPPPPPEDESEQQNETE